MAFYFCLHRARKRGQSRPQVFSPLFYTGRGIGAVCLEPLSSGVSVEPWRGNDTFLRWILISSAFFFFIGRTNFFFLFTKRRRSWPLVQSTVSPPQDNMGDPP